MSTKEMTSATVADSDTRLQKRVLRHRDYKSTKYHRLTFQKSLRFVDFPISSGVPGGLASCYL